MSEFFDSLNDEQTAFVHEQPMFFTASACADGRVNVSPKGGEGLHKVLGPNLFCYLDLTGSGNETSAHMKRDGRITIMFNSFSRKAMILRLYGRGSIASEGSEKFEAHISMFPTKLGTRQLVFVEIDQIQTSCGYAVPQMDLVGHRATLDKWSENKGRDGILDYQQQRNQVSIDGFETGLSK
jgi:hypothetical protein